MTDFSPADFRSLCAELHAVFNTYAVCEEHHRLLVRTAAVLAQPEPQGPSDEELTEMWTEQYGIGSATMTFVEFKHAIRDALARWGRPAIKPVPVTEGLPGPEDCDSNGCIWLWNGHWSRLKAEAASLTSWFGAVWLPAHALPVPQQEANRG